MAPRQRSLEESFEYFVPSVKWIPHMIRGVARLKDLFLKQGPIISSRVIDALSIGHAVRRNYSTLMLLIGPT